MTRVAVIGAGAAGLSAARRLTAAGVAVTVFDKGRRPGGRLASRSTVVGNFDPGAQFYRVRSVAPLTEHIASVDGGVARPWVVLDDAQDPDLPPAWIGAPTTNSLAQAWSAGLNVQCGAELVAIEGSAHAWYLRFANEQRLGPFGDVVVTVPAPQALAWLGATAMGQALQSIAFAPCIALMWAPQSEHLPAAAVWPKDPAPGIAWIAREDLKPGREGPPRYIVHAGAGWSAEYLDAPPDDSEAALRRLVADVLELSPSAHYAQTHHWRYARVTEAFGTDCLSSGDGLYYAGDGCLGGRIEAALRSGRAAAEIILSQR
ncbi:MAG: FAD-dependent oxidoreductase [Nevskiales bacterium]|nr:FAD-dependent oxidoreductase [Nevskiales bacterium]